MGNYNKGGRSNDGRHDRKFSGKRNFGGDRRGGGGFGGSHDRESREMFRATCSNCGNQCEVPFRPTGEKPVLCSTCFNVNRQHDHRDQRGDRHSFGGNRQDRFESGRARERGGAMSEDLARKLDQLNKKLDRILIQLKPAQDEVHSPESKSKETRPNLAKKAVDVVALKQVVDAATIKPKAKARKTVANVKKSTKKVAKKKVVEKKTAAKKAPTKKVEKAVKKKLTPSKVKKVATKKVAKKKTQPKKTK